jgi:proline iminopeptidase
MVSAYYRRLTSIDEKVRIEAARAWSIWEGTTSKLFFDPASIERFADPTFAQAFARIECHYFMNNCFFPTDNYLIEHIARIRHIPGVIVRANLPMTKPGICIARPEAELHITPDGPFDHGARRGVEATNKFR